MKNSGVYTDLTGWDNKSADQKSRMLRELIKQPAVTENRFTRRFRKAQQRKKKNSAESAEK